MTDKLTREGVRRATREERSDRNYQAARSPRAAGITGVLFAILFSISTTILHLTVGGTPDADMWLTERVGWVRFAVALMPFAGIGFLWFIGVVRTRLGRFEDQFFTTVFLGSGLLFLGMIFVATAVAGSLVAGYVRNPAVFAGSPSYYLALDVIGQIFNIYALRMAAVFLSAQATLWLRTGVMPRWLAYVTYAVSLVLLFVYGQSFWAVLVFPAWVFLVSVYVLILSLVLEKQQDRNLAPAPADSPTGASQEAEPGDE